MNILVNAMTDNEEGPIKENEEEPSNVDNAASDIAKELTETKEQLAVVADEAVKLRKQVNDSIDSTKRIQAEFENYKKRTARERDELIKCANERLLVDLLVIYDDFERAISSKCTAEEFRDGVSKIHDNLSSLLQDYGVKEMPSDGDFDPRYHEALAVGEGMDGKIIETYQKGYFLGQKVLRCSKVKVGKSKVGDNNG